MDKTVKEIQEEVEEAKAKIKTILLSFYTRNPTVILSGEFGVLRECINNGFGAPKLFNSEIMLKLKISIDEKSC